VILPFPFRGDIEQFFSQDFRVMATAENQKYVMKVETYYAYLNWT
jgi:hypothetical protein